MVSISSSLPAFNFTRFSQFVKIFRINRRTEMKVRMTNMKVKQISIALMVRMQNRIKCRRKTWLWSKSNLAPMACTRTYTQSRLSAMSVVTTTKG